MQPHHICRNSGESGAAADFVVEVWRVAVYEENIGKKCGAAVIVPLRPF